MASGDETIRGLREAVRVSPKNIPIRLLLAQSLVGLGRFEEAEQEYRAALVLGPEESQISLGLANVYVQQGKASQALVILEDLVQRRDPPGAAHVLLAELFLHRGEVADAVAQYKLGIEIDPNAKDNQLGDRLGVVPEEEAGELFEGRLRTGSQEEGVGGGDHELERPTISFSDVGGMEAVKEEIRLKIIYPMAHPEMYEAYGKPIGGGIMMYGPPGCGKTYLARATAGQIQARFLSIGINDVLDMWIGNSERNLHEIFETARRRSPCVLFFDEVDALGGRRSDMSGGGGRHAINQFLAELDGVGKSNAGVLILAATNAPWHVDAAFRRPGRFDRVLFVPPPDREARASILRIHLKGKPIEKIDFERLAQKSEGFSGADLKAVVDAAVEDILREAVKTGTPKPLSTKSLLAAVKTLRPTIREWFATARNHALYANPGGIYDDVLKHLGLE